MSSWSHEQQVRLAWEKQQLYKEGFDHFRFYDPTVRGQSTIQGIHTTSAENSYNVCILPTAYFPDEVPKLYITSPRPLIGFNGKTIQSWGTSHQMHVLSPDWNDYVKICHWRNENWNMSYTLVAVLMKGLLWLEAFEIHCKTGQTIEELSLSF